MKNDVNDLVTVAKTLTDETRQQILQHLRNEWLSVNELVEKLGGRVNQPTVSHHLKTLEEAGMVHVRQEGRYRFYTINFERVQRWHNEVITKFAPSYAHLLRPVVPFPLPPFAHALVRFDTLLFSRKRRKALRRHLPGSKKILRGRK